MEVRATREDEWPALRKVRLASLQDSPEAFWSSYEEMVDQPETFWRQRAASGTLFLAWSRSGDPVGIAGGMRMDDRPEERHLISMWVSPEARGHGIARLLVDAVVDWARADGAQELSLWVVDGNERALRLYERLGFRLTGDRQDFPGDDPRTESRMLLTLR